MHLKLIDEWLHNPDLSLGKAYQAYVLGGTVQKTYYMLQSLYVQDASHGFAARHRMKMPWFFVSGGGDKGHTCSPLAMFLYVDVDPC